eukprot:CAMPEP_0183401296 /NCGR_PEP_ID=MMETSP0370-20130417/13165_1 /TAXON_ID=268820 /ORGANISM="Peridinium aciculiferum, Strain PAER-2" /LENGTH=215 /DNA_ID=CAMNT_0025582729 /DNA_START=199 /DNA_END=848 /DNA_ORIENTATION=+
MDEHANRLPLLPKLVGHDELRAWPLRQQGMATLPQPVRVEAADNAVAYQDDVVALPGGPRAGAEGVLVVETSPQLTQTTIIEQDLAEAADPKPKYATSTLATPSSASLARFRSSRGIAPSQSVSTTRRAPKAAAAAPTRPMPAPSSSTCKPLTNSGRSHKSLAKYVATGQRHEEVPCTKPGSVAPRCSTLSLHGSAGCSNSMKGALWSQLWIRLA